MAGPNDIGVLLAQAGRLLAAGDHRAAEAPLRVALRIAPQSAEAHLMLGVVSAMRGHLHAALAAFDAALATRPGFGQAMAQKARMLDALDRREEAVKLADAASPLASDPWSQDTIGVVLTRAGQHVKAVEHYRRAAETSQLPGYHYNHASALQFLGRFDQARDAYRRCLQRDPGHALAWAGLVQITKQTQDANEIARLTAIAARLSGDTQAMHLVGHALAKAHEDLGDPGQAMAWLARAKAGLRARHDAAADAALFAAARRSVAATGGGHSSARPIFVVGMPRTGTTLVERIVSSHSAVVSAGELNDFPRALKATTGVVSDALVSAQLIDASLGADFEEIGRDYVSRVRAAQGIEGRFVDKLPLNVFLAPLILRALPEARVICLRRHPADAVLSTYRQAFESGAREFDYVFDLETAARYYLEFDSMVRLFADQLPADRFVEIAYENIVADLEGEVRRLLDFCGLGFEAACLRFEDNAAPVATASAAQVRQPLYASSVGRWRRYRPEMDPALAILAAGGVMAPEELS